MNAQTGYFYLAFLNGSSAGPPLQIQAPPPPAPVSPNASRRSSCSPAIESAITGEIKGWDGEAMFKLDNGGYKLQMQQIVKT
jgi:hypothetical protein